MRRSRGSAYVALLGLATLLFVIAYGAITAARVQAWASDLGNDASEARLYAMSAVELGRARIAADSNWRNNYSNGDWVSSKPIGNGTYTLNVINPNGALNSSLTDPVTITGTGTKGRAIQKMQVTVSGSSTPYDCLGIAMDVGGAITFNNSTVQASGFTIGSNTAMSAGGLLSSATINANVECAGLITGSSYNGTSKSLAGQRKLPLSTAFDYYTTIGTNISYGAIPVSGGVATVNQVLLSPNNNPLGGGTNNLGIYVINCANKKIVISNSRIVGTLVLLDPGAGSVIQGSMNWCPMVSTYPSLMVRGDMAISCASSALAESSSPAVNFNPAGTAYPYPSGTTNSTYTDSYPSAITGLVYVSGDLTTGNAPTIGQLIVGGAFTSSGTLTLTGGPAFTNNAPPGFGTVSMAVVAGSWKQVVN